MYHELMANLDYASSGHTGFEPEITDKKTGFNLDLGTISGTVAEGNHTHTEGGSDLNNIQKNETLFWMGG